jgi:hypothetical protein
MAARGFRVNYDGTGGDVGMRWASTNFLDPVTTSLTVCGWVRIKGAVGAGSNDQGHVVLCLPHNSTNFDTESGFSMYCMACKGGGPWVMTGEVSNNATWNDATMGTFAVDTDYFWAMVWDSATGNATWYWAADGAGSLSSATAGSGLTWGGGGAMDGIWLGTDLLGDIPRGGNLEITCVKMWVGITKDATELFSEMNSDALVDTSGGSSRSHWPIMSQSDTSDDGGSSRTLTVLGSLSAPTMDPVDIQGGGGGGGQTPSMYGLQQLGNGFGPAPAAGLQGVLAT